MAGIAAGSVSDYGRAYAHGLAQFRMQGEACLRHFLQLQEALSMHLWATGICSQQITASEVGALSIPCFSLDALTCSIFHAAWPEKFAPMLSATVMVQMSCSAVSVL